MPKKRNNNRAPTRTYAQAREALGDAKKKALASLAEQGHRLRSVLANAQSQAAIADWQRLREQMQQSYTSDRRLMTAGLKSIRGSYDGLIATAELVERAVIAAQEENLALVDQVIERETKVEPLVFNQGIMALIGESHGNESSP